MTVEQKLGTIMKELINFSLPLILSGILQQLYNWADAFIVGNIDGEQSLSAIGATTTPINFFITIITGFTLGLSVLIAKHFGAKNQDNIPPILSVFTVILGSVFLFIAIIGFILSRQFMKLLDTPTEIINLASNYIRIIFIGLPFLAVYNVYTASLRGIGNSRIPFLSILLSSIVNVILDIIFVAKLHLGVQGAAVATVFSQVVMTVFIVLYGTKKYRWLKNGYRKTSFCNAVIKEGVRFGLPPMIQSGISSFGGLILQKFMNQFGEETVTAITTAYRVDTLVMLPIVNLGSGISTITAQSNSSGDNVRTRKTLTAGTILSIVISLILTGMIIPLGGKIVKIFGAGETAVAIGSAFFQRIACFYPVFGLTTAFRGYLEGKGDLLYSSISGIISLVVRIIASYVMAPFFDNMSIAYAEMFSWVWLLAMYLLRFARTRTKIKSMQK